MVAKEPSRWSPFEDLRKDDLRSASDELSALASVWSDEKQRIGNDRALAQFNERLAREWAIETGILERIYTLDRGTTQLLIEQGIDSALIPHESTDQPPELVAAIISDQFTAVEWLFDFVSAKRELTTHFVKELHALMTRNQRTFAAVDQFGKSIEVELAHGEYKAWPNSPTRPDGSIHEYCPPEQVASEMDRLVQLHREHLAIGVPPEVESAWLHHRFTQIHPFQDGNGRIARALASLVFLREEWFPLVITRDDRTKYLEALETADSGDLTPLVQLFASRQRWAFVAALGIAREVVLENERVDQVLDSIGEMFAQKDEELRQEQVTAKDTADVIRDYSKKRLQEVATQLEERMGVANDRHAFVDFAPPPNDRRDWHRAQILEATHQFGYFAGFRDYSAWVRLCIQSETGRSELLTSFHSVGREYRGVIGVIMVFFRRSESDNGTRETTGVQVLGDESFQINYREDPGAVRERFSRWFERGLVEGLEAWRRSE